MFGYVIADLARLDEGQQTRYKSFYCGLCRALYRGYGPVPALALTYDMAFLTLFLSALYEPAEQSGALPAPSGAGAELDADGIHRLRGGNELPAGL